MPPSFAKWSSKCRWNGCWLKPIRLIWHRCRIVASRIRPAYVRDVAEFVAELKGVSLEALAEQTTSNFFELFKQARRQQAA